MFEKEIGKKYIIRLKTGRIITGIVYNSETFQGNEFVTIGKEFIPIMDILFSEEMKDSIENNYQTITIKKKHDSSKDYCKVCGNVLPERKWCNDKSERLGKCCSLKCWKEDVMDNYVKKGKRIHEHAMSYFSPEEQKEIKRIYKEGKK